MTKMKHAWFPITLSFVLTHSSDRFKSVWRVRKHETQSYRESCVFHFGHFELFIYIYRLKGWYMSADRPRKEKSFYRDNQIGFQFNHICIVLKQITQQIHTLQVCVNFWCRLYKRFNFRPTVTRQRVSLKRDRFPCLPM